MSVPSYVKLSPQMDTATLINALNQNFNQVQSQDRRKVITDEDGNDRIVLGRQDDGTYAIRVSEAGRTVETATQDQLVMSSDFKMWKIIQSGSALLTPASLRRSGSVTLNSTYIGYTSDMFIRVDGIKELLSSNQGFTGQVQLFVRSNMDKSDVKDSGTLYHDGSNWVVYNHSYFLHSDGYLVIRTDIRWMGGSVSITPRSQGLPVYDVYWEIANPTRQVPGGMGGGGSPTGKYVYYDSGVYNGTTKDLNAYDFYYNPVTIPPKGFSGIYSYTYQYIDNASSYRYPKDAPMLPYPPIIL